MSINDYYQFRRKLTDALTKDLIGCSAEDEVIDDPPITRYISGILYPRQSGTLDPAVDVDAADDDDEGALADPPVALANVRYPSSMGMTFAVDLRAAPRITLRVRAGRYVPIEEECNVRPAPEPGDPKAADPQPAGPRRAGKTQRWRREAVTVIPLELDLTTPSSDYHDTSVAGLQLFCRVRPADGRGFVPVTAVLLNAKTAPAGQGLGDADAFFQPEIEATAPGAVTAPFVERPVTGLDSDDEDIRAYRLLYRHAREFATGHGCSVRWTVAPDASDRATAIMTTYSPEFEIALADSNPDIKARATGMLYLIEGKRADVLRDLEELCAGYERWIGDRRTEADAATDLNAEQRGTARTHLDFCAQALRRMRRGVETLAEDDMAWNAFQLMNAAMLSQRARTVWLRTGAPAGGPAENSEHQWRPFQLAFILLCLEGIARPASDDRRLVDLLWFPTGGGKTEAYLGLIAFSVFLRRLRRKDGGGVTALMRYTLRLLTIQQFERASLLICCCEAIRRRKPELGKEPISIGLWLGKGATPNTLAEARTALNKLRAKVPIEKENPIQLHACPWCGAPLDHRNYWIGDDPKRLVVSCRQEGCDFKDRLPVFLVDEDVYKYRPTLIIATVDKFAGLPWREKAAALLNLADAERDEQPRPELIIQDELHLISGPLGTLVGLYETVIDTLSTQDGAGPKVIASTATIRRAGQQARGLFNRGIRQFPPPGLDARNSYFAVEAAPHEKGTRMYMGLMAPGTSHTTLLVRSYAALLQSAAEIPAPDAVKDPYWTLVGYFNSLRVLGGARMQVQDDVDDRMELLASKRGTAKRAIDERIELTSREPSGDIPGHLKRMAVGRPSAAALDVILATNMISVGVDIDRLGLMVVMGQPQSTSEYIQSTSRVGRRFPGLVLVLFNSARSRDRSHYESFVAYHSAIYRQVESTSVTPFSARARDRGLHAVLIALARLLIPELRPNAAAELVNNHGAKLAAIKNLIVERVREVAEGEADATELQLEQLLDDWKKRAAAGTLVYQDVRDPSKALLRSADATGPDKEDGLPTLWSLRDVDQESNLYLVQ